MTAQQQLVEFVKYLTEGAQVKDVHEFAEFVGNFCRFIRDHGPALVELIAEVVEQKAWFDRIVEHRQAGGDVPHAMLDRSAQSRKRMHEIIAKLTEPK